MKADNVNAVRTAHYNHAERFMELCDEAGFYVLDEIPSCWVATEIKDPSRTWAFVFRSVETLKRDKNRPCVVAWSCGNESSYGINNQAEFDYVKANDPSRLAFISQANLRQAPKTQFEDYHSPPLATMIATATKRDRAKIPVILTEYHPGGGGHLGGEDRNWDVMWSSDAFAGAFIWEWQEQGMYDKFPERWNIPAPSARNDPKTGYRVSGAIGVVSADRQRQSLFDVLKPLYSPVSTTVREIAPADGQCVVPLQNRYSFTDLSEITCRWQALAGEKVLTTGESHIEARPRSTVNATFPASPGMDTLRLEFFHPDGRSLFATSLHTKDYHGPLPTPILAPAARPMR
jgi:beta-galactosidase